MNFIFLQKVFKKALLALALSVTSTWSVFAVSVSIGGPQTTLPTRDQIVVFVVLNPERDTLSSISGNFSFPSDMFTVVDISNAGSVVPLWITQPSLSKEKYLDNRTHIIFEGIFPGGFDGVRSATYLGKKEGIIFAVTLLPKAKGVGSFIVDDLFVTSFTPQADQLPVSSAIRYVSVPTLIGTQSPFSSSLVRTESKTLQATISRDILIDNNAWYVMVHDSHEKSAIESMYVAETNDYNGELVSESAWRSAKNPYVLLYQERNKFVHVKIVYADKTYTTLTLPPVENSQHISQLSRILVSIIIVLFVLYTYGKSSFTFFKKR
jgi:hypothetical protein